MTEKLTPERAVRLLRAKGAELEAVVALHAETSDGPWSIDLLRADIALIAQLLADFMEANQTVRITGPEASGTSRLRPTLGPQSPSNPTPTRKDFQ